MPLPAEFISSIQSLLGEETEYFLAELGKDAPTSIRLNPFKNNSTQNIIYEKVEWSKFGYYLPDRPAFTFDPLFHAGYYYVQEASSMFVEYIVRQLIHEPCVCLDSCAAPGGKSVSILSALPEGSLLVSNEIIRSRANVLSENMTKFGHPNSVVTNNAPKDFQKLPNFFDMILVDAPCSGEGMFRKDEVAVKEWSPANVKMCCARQRDILQDVWDSLKPGGYLIYSTCTFNMSENEDNARWIADELGAEFVDIEVPKEWRITTSLRKDVVAYRFLPHKTKGEGLFVSVFQKTSDDCIGERKNKKQNGIVEPKDKSDLTPLLTNSEKFIFTEQNNIITALPRLYADKMMTIKNSLNVLSMGIRIGERKGKNFIPAHQLAMSIELSPDYFPRVELGGEEALAFLRTESITLQDAPIGYVLVAYQGCPLGLVKNLGNRANNLYPKEWRIRSGYVPEKLVKVLK